MGDRAAVECFNRGDRGLFTALLVRDLSGALRAPVHDVSEVQSGARVRLGTGTEVVAIEPGDAELVIALSIEESLLERVVQSPWEEHDEEDATLSVMALPFEVKLIEQYLSDKDLSQLMQRAIDDNFSSDIRVLQALTLLPLPQATTTSLNAYLRRALRYPYAPQRPVILDLCANLRIQSTRNHLRAIAEDDTDPHRTLAIRALAEVGDKHVAPELIALLQSDSIQRQFAAQYLAFHGHQHAFLASRGEDDATNLWLALAAACTGEFAAFDELFLNADSISFRRLIRDPANLHFAIRNLRPLPHLFGLHVTKLLTEKDLAEPVRAFLSQLVSDVNAERSVTDGIRPIPEILAEKIRQRLRAIPSLLDLASFESEQSPGWVSVNEMSPARRGVMLSELLATAAALPNEGLAVDTVAIFTNAWARYHWYPDLSGLFTVARQVNKDNLWSERLMTQQIGWAVSRAPLSVVVRLVNDRLTRGTITTSELDIFCSAILTHWDDTPPPSQAILTRLPWRLQRQISEEPPIPPRRKAQAWVERDGRSPGAKDVTVYFTIGAPEQGVSGQADEEPTRELTVMLLVEGGHADPSSATMWLPAEKASEPTRFSISPSADIVRLRFLVYLPDAGILLQELHGSFALSAVS